MTTPITKEKFTKEQLIARIETQKETALKHPECSVALMDLEIANIALAAMDAEPVAWTDEQELRDVERSGCGYLFTCNPVTPHADERRVIKLYAAPPAPVVPPMQHWEELCREHPDMSIGDAIIRAAWWNHCRAAMLNHPSSIQPNTDATPGAEIKHPSSNSPVIPEGYVMVPMKLSGFTLPGNH